MAVNTRHFDGLTPEDVFRVLADGETYAYWVVGTRKIREVSSGWPAPGSEIHYTVGHLPFRKDDRTTATECDRPRLLRLEAHAWPMGSMDIELRSEPTASGCTVTLEEGPKTGMLKVLSNPFLDLAIKTRNVETLRRLESKTRELAANAVH